jgi:uncharacterized protein (UPF0262 family)
MRRTRKARLDESVGEATVDCYNEYEQATGLFTMIEEHRAIPFQTEVLGVAATVSAVDIAEDGRVVAICSRGGNEQRISILDVPLPNPLPVGAEWIEAYRHWLSPKE